MFQSLARLSRWKFSIKRMVFGMGVSFTPTFISVFVAVNEWWT
jgi:hypothetical protein